MTRREPTDTPALSAGDEAGFFVEPGRRAIPVYVELLSQQLPVLPLGVGGVEGGADPLPDGGGDFEGPRPRLRGDGTVRLGEKGNHSLFALAAGRKRGGRCQGDLEHKDETICGVHKEAINKAAADAPPPLSRPEVGPPTSTTDV